MSPVYPLSKDPRYIRLVQPLYVPPDVEPIEHDDLAEGLDAARGILTGLVIASLFWMIAGVAWWKFHHG